MFEAVFVKNEAEKTLVVERQFDAPREKVWHAWTDSNILEKWWAPRPWKAFTVSFSFTEGGKWHYYMSGPEGEKHYAMIEYKTITPQESYTAIDAFADENGNMTTNLPVAHYKTEFFEQDGRTRMRTTTVYESLKDMNTVLEMGMAEGLAMGFRQLDEVLAA